MQTPHVRAAWILAGLFLMLLGVISMLSGPPHLPSADQLIRAYVRTPHERITLA